ncbi:MAG TPA: tripartite tricarboxylate transporter substrate-binding protein [Burkholderiales bacterium]|nr:tripartite tricarboxylate transporter substrate-binding protein [Burkholderiales bacterium]
MQSVLQKLKYFDAPITVVNRAGAGSALSGLYVNKFEGNGHYVLLSGKALVVSDLMGRLPFQYTDLTPLAHLMDEYIGVAVKADSPIRSGRDLLDRLKKDPAAHSVAVATALGNANHQAVASAMKASGIDPRKARTVIFNSGGAAMTALLGGHVDVVPVSVGLLTSSPVTALSVTSYPSAFRNSPVTLVPSASMKAISLLVVMKRQPLRMKST